MPVLVTYLFVIIFAEGITIVVHPIAGIIIYLFILLATLLQPAIEDKYHPNRLILSLSLIPLIRIISLTMPLVDIPQIWWYPIIYLPLFIAAIVVIRILGYSRRDIGLNWGSLPIQLLIGVTGLGLGLIEYLILKPEPLITELTFQAAFLPALVLIVTTGFVEELIFRGVLQRTAMESINRLGIVYVSLVFAVLHIGFLSVIDVAFVFVVALSFGWLVNKTGSLLGVTLAHGTTNIMLFIIAPFILG